MSEMFNPSIATTAFDHTTTIVAVLELSGKTWLFGACAPGIARRIKQSIEARDIARRREGARAPESPSGEGGRHGDAHRARLRSRARRVLDRA